MKPFLHERLYAALLLEISSEHYAPESKFLSLREISRRFGVSKPTANLVQSRLIREGFVEARPRSGVYLRRESTERAMLVLDTLPFSSIPKPRIWKARKIRVCQPTPAHNLKVGIIYHEARVAIGRFRAHAQVPDNVPARLRGLRGCLASAKDHEIAVKFILHEGSEARHLEVEALLQNAQFDGLLIIQRSASFPELHSLIDPLLKAGIPVVNLFGSPQGADMITVEFNNVAAGHQAVSVLAKAGHKDIVLMMAKGATISAIHRAEGAKLAASQWGVHLEILELVGGKFEEQIARRLASDPTPKAVIGLGFDYTVSAIAAYAKIGLVAGRDYSCLGFSSTPDLPDGEKCDIMRMDFDAAGATAMDTLLDEIGGNENHRIILIPMEYEDWGTVTARILDF